MKSGQLHNKDNVRKFQILYGYWYYRLATTVMFTNFHYQFSNFFFSINLIFFFFLATLSHGPGQRRRIRSRVIVIRKIGKLTVAPFTKVYLFPNQNLLVVIAFLNSSPPFRSVHRFLLSSTLIYQQSGPLHWFVSLSSSLAFFFCFSSQTPLFSCSHS